MGYESAFQFDDLSLHSELQAYIWTSDSGQFSFHFSSVFPKLATGIIWEALNGNDGANIGFNEHAKRHSVAPRRPWSDSPSVVWLKTCSKLIMKVAVPHSNPADSGGHS